MYCEGNTSKMRVNVVDPIRRAGRMKSRKLILHTYIKVVYRKSKVARNLLEVVLYFEYYCLLNGAE